MTYEPVRAPRGGEISCKGWHQEAAMRMLMNNLDEEVAEDPRNLIVYGGTGKAARDWNCFHAIVDALKTLENDETLLVQSGKPVGVFGTHEMAPRVLIANSNLVPRWATWEHFRRLEALGLIMYGQMTAGSWIYIGTQGILQGTYETFAAAARKHFGGSLKGRMVVSGGIGGMSGAQPLAATMNEGVFLGADVDAARIKRRIEGGYLDEAFDDVDAAIDAAAAAKDRAEARSFAVTANQVVLLRRLLARGIVPDVLTDQTSAHDPLNGYVPAEVSYEDALRLRGSEPERYVEAALRSMAEHCSLMVELMKKGAVTFDYGNNLRGHAKEAGFEDAFAYPGFVEAYIRPMFCEGRGPFRWCALSGDPEDIYRTDAKALELFPDDAILRRWMTLARKRVRFQGLPCRICWLGYGERDRFGLAMNDMVKRGELGAPVVIGRDHLDGGSVASPNRETEGMRDGSDAVADWPLLNALLNTASGASWVSIHHGGGVGMGYSIHAGFVMVADGTADCAARIERVLTNDPGTAVMRHADAGYPEALEFADRHGLKTPLL